MKRKKVNPSLLLPGPPARTMREIEENGRELLETLDQLPEDYEDEDRIYDALFQDIGDR